ncbi:MAG: SHOCT domain-containing protein [Gaiellales bacterium]|jgi:predicted PurR-regulated permease PerM
MAVLALGDFLWSLLVIFFMVIYFMMLFQVIADVFRRRDISAVKKTAWLLFLLIVPVLSLIVYSIANGEGMALRNVDAAQQSRARFDDHVREVSGAGSAAEIAKGKELLDSGAISESEYQQLKARALAA